MLDDAVVADGAEDVPTLVEEMTWHQPRKDTGASPKARRGTGCLLLFHFTSNTHVMEKD